VIASCDDPKQPPIEILPSAEPTVGARDPADEDATAAMPNSVTTVNGDTRPDHRRPHGSPAPMSTTHTKLSGPIVDELDII
jgi:hypothetical protein